MTIKEITGLIEEGQSLKEITQVFTQIASSKLKKIRAGVEKNREFFVDLSTLFGLVNTIAVRRGITLKQRNGKTLAILLSSNERFYGKISGDLLEYFIVQTSKIRSDKIVIGKSAVETMKSMSYAMQYTPMILKADFPNNEEALKLSQIVNQYSKVLVFHPLFESVLTQTPTISDITKSQEQINTNAAETKKLASEYNNYIVEPEIQIMAEFFDSQIKTLLLMTTFLEAELARTASRLISMDRAQSEAEKYLGAKQQLLFNAKRSIANGRILEMVAGLNGSKSVSSGGRWS